MKKVFLLSLGLIMGLGAFAQNMVMKNDIAMGTAKGGIAIKEDVKPMNFGQVKSVVNTRYQDLYDEEVVDTYYDLQSNQYVANRMYQLPNGSVAAVATMSHQNNQTASDRGTGYAFYDGEDWTEMLPDNRIEEFKTGWPSIAQWGANGEILLAHGNGHMQCFTRATAGEGDWEYRGALPDYPEGYPYPTEYPTWPRVVTCGPNHDIIVAVAALQHSISDDETDVRTVMWRSEDATNWTISYGPLADLGLGYEVGFFSADDYCMSSNGNTVALLYSGCMTNSTWLFKSTDTGLTWEARRVWEDPYEGISLEDPELVYTDTLYRPMNGAVVVDNHGVVHVALNTFEMAHWADTEPGYYSYFYGRAVDGILYWNDTQEGPVESEDGNPHHAARLWWPSEESGYVRMHADSTKWIGFIPMFEGYSWDNENFFFAGDSGSTEYVSKFYGASGHQALSCDPNGNLACAFSSPNVARTSSENGKYYRSIFVSYRNVAEGYWHQVEDDITGDDMFLISECVFTMSAPNTVNAGEFWFGFQADTKHGFYWGSNASQTTGTNNEIHVMKVIANEEFVNASEVKDAVYSIYPNPASDRIVISSAMNVNATITFVNLAGQTVKSFNRALTTGENAINIDLESGVYFCTINANGSSKTTKVIVK